MWKAVEAVLQILQSWLQKKKSTADRIIQSPKSLSASVAEKQRYVWEVLQSMYVPNAATMTMAATNNNKDKKIG